MQGHPALAVRTQRVEQRRERLGTHDGRHGVGHLPTAGAGHQGVQAPRLDAGLVPVDALHDEVGGIGRGFQGAGAREPGAQQLFGGSPGRGCRGCEIARGAELGNPGLARDLAARERRVHGEVLVVDALERHRAQPTGELWKVVEGIGGAGVRRGQPAQRECGARLDAEHTAVAGEQPREIRAVPA